jgi:predicted transcriptional regulator
MPTSIHLPKSLLDAVDRRAKAQRMSRNRFIVRALEKELDRAGDWSPGFFETLAEVEPGDDAVVGEMLEAIRTARRSRSPRRL